MKTSHTVAAIRMAEERMARDHGWDALMMRAAAGLAEEMSDIPAGDVVLMLVGPGNNGGDALFAAVHLLDRGVRVDLALLDPNHVHQAGLAAAQSAGANLVSGPSSHRWVVDALYGIGSREGLDGLAAEWASQLDDAFVIAVDVPSGIGVDSARSQGTHIWADRTVTFGTLKNALVAMPALSACGDIRLVDIGLRPYLDTPDVEVLDDTDGYLLDTVIPVPQDHKYSRGVLGIATGSPEFAGAAHLSVAGALAGPVGMVRFLGDPELSARVVDRAPEVVAVSGPVQAWVVGSGGGEQTQEYLAAALKDEVPCVVDAEALKYITRNLGDHLVLTPHAGELAQLLGVQSSEIESEPLAYARRAASEYGATVLLKGARTVIATVNHPTRINPTGSPWLATAGSGDVLAGLIGSFLAAGMDSHDAASVAAYLHGKAAELIPGPLSSSFLATLIPSTFADWAEL